MTLLTLAKEASFNHDIFVDLEQRKAILQRYKMMHQTMFIYLNNTCLQYNLKASWFVDFVLIRYFVIFGTNNIRLDYLNEIEMQKLHKCVQYTLFIHCWIYLFYNQNLKKNLTILYYWWNELPICLLVEYIRTEYKDVL